LEKYNNIYKGTNYFPFNLPHDVELDFDVPHELDDVATQMKRNKVNGKYAMQGFVEAYAKVTGAVVNPECTPMGFFNAEQVPITHFLAKNFCVCDQWFCSMPTSTQPNRTMAFTGDSGIYKTKTQLIDVPNNIFKWMNKNSIRWRVYHDGLPFFILYPKLWPYLLSDRFRRYEYLYSDLMHEADENKPQVIIIEPCYEDAPHLGSKHPNDNHSPLAIGWGEDFIRRTYQAITANKKLWENTVMILYYDEHGGFYDHVAPPKISYQIKGKDPYSFESLGPRIPGIIISPFVKPGSVSHELLDHTSVLQFLAEVFTPKKSYSASVASRRKSGIMSINDTLINDAVLNPPPAPLVPLTVQTAFGKSIAVAPQSDMQSSFEQASLRLLKNNPTEVAKKFP
ncbi:MAG: alkaline phosphatase family protein, partial [Ginsengibacter sp.]